MAYPNSNINSSVTNVLPLNDLYTNHSLLTTTSTTTGSYLLNGKLKLIFIFLLSKIQGQNAQLSIA